MYNIETLIQIKLLYFSATSYLYMITIFHKLKHFNKIRKVLEIKKKIKF